MTSLALPDWTNSGTDVLGRVEPRLWTRPLRDLTDPAATFGYELIDFAEDIGWPLDPWQKWLAIHLGELLPNGVPRFRIVLVLVARQNGKSVFCRILTLFWMFIEAVPVVFGINSSRDTAKKSWKEVIKMAEEIELLAEELPAVHIVKQVGEEDFWNDLGSHYLFGAPNSRAGRSLTINRAVIDELRQHKNRDAWDALIPTMNAVRDAQAVIITNEGDETAMVLHELAESAEAGDDPRLGMFSWSCPPGADPLDLEMLAYANPDLGNRLQAAALLGQAKQATRAGGETLARFRVEMMCQRVQLMDPAIEPELWDACGTDEPIDLAEHRRRVAVCFDVSMDGTHCTAVAAATVDGITHVEVVGLWSGYGCTKAMREELPELVARIRPRRVAWFPNGPAAGAAIELKQRKGGRRPWPPAGIRVEELTDEQAAAAMSLADVVRAGQLRHPRDEMLTQHVKRTQRVKFGDRWKLDRSDGRPVDGTYALAGAAYAARMMPVYQPLVVG